jgi:tRNA dimethylallyltransferase
VGKTAVALALADILRERGEDPVAISADALQVYRGLETLTGVATPEERARLEHRLVGIVPVADAFSVGAYMPLAHAEIDAALAAGRRPIVVGGTGLYLRAALAELSMRKVDPGGESELWSRDTRHPTLLCGLTMDREALYAAIEHRVDAIVAAGAEAEVRAAVAAGASRTARKALGFDELLRDDVGAMKKRSRNYARRQLTWMRKMAGVHLIDVTGRDAAHVAAQVEHVLASGQEVPSAPAP